MSIPPWENERILIFRKQMLWKSTCLVPCAMQGMMSHRLPWMTVCMSMTFSYNILLQNTLCFSGITMHVYLTEMFTVLTKRTFYSIFEAKCFIDFVKLVHWKKTFRGKRFVWRLIVISDNGSYALCKIAVKIHCLDMSCLKKESTHEHNCVLNTTYYKVVSAACVFSLICQFNSRDQTVTSVILLYIITSHRRQASSIGADIYSTDHALLLALSNAQTYLFHYWILPMYIAILWSN